MARRSRLPVPPRPTHSELWEVWGISIDEDLLNLALTHRSYAYEAGGMPHNERLEFLGDSVLGMIVADRLYEDYPELAESDLSKMRAATVSQAPLAMVARDLGLGDFILLGKGEGMSGGREKDSILSDTVEALIGATYLTHGVELTRQVVLNLLVGLLDRAVERGQTQDWKTLLVEFANAQDLGVPTYSVTGQGPDHQRIFTAEVSLGGGEVQGVATESSKKHAENMAARDAMTRLDPQGLSR